MQEQSEVRLESKLKYLCILLFQIIKKRCSLHSQTNKTSSFITGVALIDLEEISLSLEDMLYLKAHKKENYK